MMISTLNEQRWSVKNKIQRKQTALKLPLQTILSPTAVCVRSVQRKESSSKVGEDEVMRDAVKRRRNIKYLRETKRTADQRYEK